MIKIKFFATWTNSQECKQQYEAQIRHLGNISNNYGKTFVFTNDDDYTHVVILNTAMPKLNIPKENVIGLAFEPNYFLHANAQFIEYAKKHISRYHIGDKQSLPDLFVEKFAYMWHSNPCREITVKNKIMSIILSNKTMAPGHKYRHDIVKEIISHKLPIDIYGRGSNKYKYEDRIKGPFNDDMQPYGDYYFTIAIENFQLNAYVSEKIMSPIMHNTMPIYLGCKNIDNYLENVIKLSGNLIDDIQLITNICNSPEKYYRKTYTEKNIISVNFVKNIEKEFNIS
jgi:hypothetical protein